MSLKASGRLLTASREDRKLRYLLLPYGETGSTNKGKILASAGSVTVPAGVLPVNLEHDYTRPVGVMETEETGAGLEAVVDVANTRAGDDVLEEAAAGLRAGISVEIDKPVVRAGKLLAGVLTGAGLCVIPAYPSAKLLAADFGDLPEDPAPADAAEAVDDLDAAKAAIESGDLDAAAAAIKRAQEAIDPDEEPKKDKEPIVPKPLTASAPNPLAQLQTLLASGNLTGAPAAPENEMTLARFTASVREGLQLGDGKLQASHLDTLTQTDLYDPATQPAFLGELWRAAPYEEIWAGLVAKEGLTAMSHEGYRWVEGSEPIVDDWEPAFVDGDEDAEDPADRRSHMLPIPTSSVRLEKKSFHAKRIAGGNRFDRVHLDFPVPGVMESFLGLQTDYIKRRRDARVRSAVLAQAAAHKITKGYTSRDLENTFRRIIFGAMSVMPYGKPTFSVVGNDIYRDMLGTDMLENLALLEKSLGLEGGSMAGFRIQPALITDHEMDGRVIVGVDKSVVLHEPAGAPIRVDAQDLAVGAYDKAVFSYYMLRSDDRGGMVEVPAE